MTGSFESDKSEVETQAVVSIHRCPLDCRHNHSVSFPPRMNYPKWCRAGNVADAVDPFVPADLLDIEGAVRASTWNFVTKAGEVGRPDPVSAINNTRVRAFMG